MRYKRSKVSKSDIKFKAGCIYESGWNLIPDGSRHFGYKECIILAEIRLTLGIVLTSPRYARELLEVYYLGKTGNIYIRS